MSRRSFDQIRASILFDESLHKIVDGINYGVDMEKLCQRLEAECRMPVSTKIKQKHRRRNSDGLKNLS